MFAIIQTGGKQYKVTEGQTLDVEKLNRAVGDKVEFDVLMVADENGIMHLGEVPSASAFFEEIIHYTQIQKYGSMSSTDFIERDAREIAANRKLLKHGKNYGFSENDFSEIRNNLMQWEESFKRRVGVSYDESDIKREI